MFNKRKKLKKDKLQIVRLKLYKIIDTINKKIFNYQGVIEQKLKNKYSKKLLILYNETSNIYNDAFYVLDSFENMLRKWTNDKTYKTVKDYFELTLNTNINLLYNENIQENIILAINELKQKTIYQKNLLVDIYCVLIEISNHYYHLCGEMLGNNQHEEMLDKVLPKIECKKTSPIYELLSEIANEDNFENAWKTFYDNLYLLKDICLIKINSGIDERTKNIKLYDTFDSIKEVKENLYTPFYGGEVNCLSAMVFQRAYRLTLSRRCIVLDTNSVSYIRTFMKAPEKLSTKAQKSIDKLKQLFRLGVGFDFSPYYFENNVFVDEENIKVEDTLLLVEKFFYENQTEAWCREAIKIHTAFPDGWKEYFVEIYNLYYCYLLIIIYVEFKNKRKTIIKKVEELCNIYHSKLYSFSHPMVEIACNFFKKKSEYHFFHGVQKGCKDIIKTLKNMTWDIVHMHVLERQCSIIEDGADYYVPYFYSFDKDFFEVKKCFDLKAIFINKKTHDYVPFYNNFSYDYDLYLKYQNVEKERYRENNYSIENITKLISKYEHEVEALIKTNN